MSLLAATHLAGRFGPGPVVVGPPMADLKSAVVSAGAADAAPELSSTAFFSCTMLFTASATPEFGTSAMASTLSVSIHCRAMLTPTSGLFW